MEDYMARPGKAGFWWGVILSLVPIVQKIAEGFGYPIPIDLGGWGSILSGGAGATGMTLLARSPAVGKNK